MDFSSRWLVYNEQKYTQNQIQFSKQRVSLAHIFKIKCYGQKKRGGAEMSGGCDVMTLRSAETRDFDTSERIVKLLCFRWCETYFLTLQHMQSSPTWAWIWCSRHSVWWTAVCKSVWMFSAMLLCTSLGLLSFVLAARTQADSGVQLDGAPPSTIGRLEHERSTELC